MSDKRELILKLFKEFPQQVLSLVSQLYRENGPEEIIFQGEKFTNRDKLMDDAVFDKLSKKIDFKEAPQNNANRLRVKQMLQFGTLEKFTALNLDKYKKRMQKSDYTGAFIIMPKYDGIGMRVYYDADGNFTALTRYDKNYGLDISFKIYDGMIPKLKSCALRGEIMTLVEHDGYRDRRTYASSQVSNMEKFSKDIVFIPYEYQRLEQNGYYAPDYTEQLKQLPFKHVFEIHTLEKLSVDLLEKFYHSIPKEYFADGVVIRPIQSVYTYEPERERPFYTAAYKLEGTKAEGEQTVDKIEFSVGQGGYLHPTIWIEEPVIIEGKKYQKATGNNFEYIVQENLLPGNKCKLSVRTVPRIQGIVKEPIELTQEAETKARQKLNITKCPQCGGPIQWDKDSVFRYKCKNYYKKCCWFYLVQRTNDVLKVKGMGEKGVQKLIQTEGFHPFDYILELKPTQLQLFLILSEGMGPKKAEKEFSKEKLLQLIEKYK